MTQVFVPYIPDPSREKAVMTWVRDHIEECYWSSPDQTHLVIKDDMLAMIFRLTFGL